MAKIAAKIALVTICMLALSVFAPQAKAQDPSGEIVFQCPNVGSPCTGSASFVSGNLVATGVGVFLDTATNPGSPSFIGDLFTLAINTGANSVTLTEVTGPGGFNLSGTVTSFQCVGGNCFVFATFSGLGSAIDDGEIQFSLGPGGAVESAGISVVTPEPASMLLMGTGLVSLGGLLRRRRQAAK